MDAELRIFGDWIEGGASGAHARSVRDFVLPDGPLPDAPLVAGYLDAAYCIAASSGFTFRDVFTGETAKGPIDLRTDGEWLWPQTLAYYVRHRDLTLPNGFLERIRTLGYQPPRFSEDEKRDVTARFQKLLDTHE